jgi:hypothetical protein
MLLDFDGDGKDDLLFFDAKNNTVNIRLSQYTAKAKVTTLAAKIFTAPFGHAKGQILSGDFNADNKDDLFFADPTDNTLYVQLSTGSGLQPKWVLTIPNGFGQLARGGFYRILDFSGDKRADVLFFEPDNNSINYRIATTTMLGKGYVGKFGHLNGQLLVSNFNGDTQDDLIFADYNTLVVTGVAATGSYTFPTPVQLACSNCYGHLTGGGFYR